MNEHDRGELRVWALQRSGHHAVLEWMLAGLEGPWVFLNHVEPGRNPFEVGGCDRERSRAVDGRGEAVEIDWEAGAGGSHPERRWLVYNLEDRSFAEGMVGEGAIGGWLWGEGGLPDASSPTPQRRREEERVEPRRVEVLILRDPFNNLASKLKWFEGRGVEPDAAAFAGYVDLWKEQAREALGRTRQLAGPTVVLLYNCWFTDAAYRRERASALGLRAEVGASQRVARYGPVAEGESFDGLHYDGRAGEMKVLERWRRFSGDAFYRSLFRDEELLDLSRALFGEMEAEGAVR